MAYRSTPHSSTGQAPAELMFGRTLRTRMDLMKPNLGSHVQSQQEKQITRHNQHSRVRELDIGDRIFMRNFGTGKPWLAGKIVQRRGPLSYLVRLVDERYFPRHLDHLRIHTCEENYVTTDMDSDFPWLEISSAPQTSHSPRDPLSCL
jgi:hypothetical protein